VVGLVAAVAVGLVAAGLAEGTVGQEAADLVGGGTMGEMEAGLAAGKVAAESTTNADLRS
jgi:hypothetical protein